VLGEHGPDLFLEEFGLVRRGLSGNRPKHRSR